VNTRQLLTATITQSVRKHSSAATLRASVNKSISQLGSNAPQLQESGCEAGVELNRAPSGGLCYPTHTQRLSHDMWFLRS